MVRDLACLLASGSAQAKFRTVELFVHLDEKEQHAWDQAWAAHAQRFAAEIEAARAA